MGWSRRAVARARRPVGRAVAAALLLAAPGVAVLLGLAALGLVPPLAALAGAAVAAAGILAIAAPWLRDAVDAEAYLDRLADADGPPPRLRSALGRGLVGAADRLRRAAAAREVDLARRLETSSAVVEALSDPLLLLDRDRTVLRANAAAAELFGARASGQDLAATMRHPDVLRAVGAVLAGEDARTVEWTQPGPVERVFEVQVRAGVGRAPAGLDGPAALVALHDITAMRRAERMRADFVANASHELRTPLSTLIGFLDTLRGPARDDAEARDRFLGIMADQAARMARLIGDLLSLSRIELDEHMAPRDRVDLAGLLARVADMMHIRAAQRDIGLVLDIRPDVPPVAGDSDQLIQVFQNLIDNAVKYARPGTAVTIAARPAGGGRVAVSVQDRGEGIERVHLPRLTERFYRVDTARSRAMGGTGLGLAIVKHIVNRHRGRLHIDSVLGEGSTFTVVLPEVSPEPPVIKP